MTNSARWQRAELLVFTTVTLLNLLPFVATRFFPSMDGASHLANSNILNQLVFYHNHLFQQFFSVNPEPVPNWTSHLVISLLTLVMPAFLAEKIMILALLAGIPFAFRSLVRIISPKNYLYSFLVFPFTHSMFLFFGFFNFCAGVLFLLITLTYWLRNENNRWNTRSIIIFTLLVAATYFSHIVVFGLLIILIILQVVTHSLMQWVCKKQDAGTGFIFLVKRSTIILAASIIPTLLFGYFFYSRPGTRQIAYKTRAELVEYIYTVRPIISFNVSVESRYTIPLFCLLAVMVVTGLAIFIKRLESRTFRYKGTHDEPGNSLLPGSSFCDNALLTHALGEQRLTEHAIDLV